jgi:tetratricopeptide (TPR) repeat protein
MVEPKEDPEITDLMRARMLKQNGKLSDACSLVEAALKESPPDRSDLLIELVELSARLGRFSRAHSAIDELLRINAFEKSDNRRLKIIEQQAIVAFIEGQYREAGAQARRLYTELQRMSYAGSPLLASVHNVLGGVAWHQGRISEAIEHVQESARICDECGDGFGAANVHRNLGVLYFTNGEWPKAIESFAKSEKLCDEIECSIGRSATLLNLGILETSTGDHVQARRHLEECIAFSNAMGEQPVRAHAEIALAHLDLVEGNAARASERLDALLRDRATLAEDTIVQASWLKATIECDRGGMASALSLAAEARRMAHEASLVESESDCCRVLGHAYMSSQALPDAEAALGEAIALAEQLNDPYRRALALLELGDLYEKMHRPSDAEKRVDEATKVFHELGARYDVARAQTVRARLTH